MDYVYNATVLTVHDGDTLHLEVDLKRRMRVKDADLGFSTYVRSGSLVLHEDFRLFGINAPELRNPDGSGTAALEYFDSLLRNDQDQYAPLVIQTIKSGDHEKQEKYGRWLARLWPGGTTVLDPTTSLNQKMVDSGHAVPFMV